MRRPQFSLKTLFWLMACACCAVGGWSFGLRSNLMFNWQSTLIQRQIEEIDRLEAAVEKKQDQRGERLRRQREIKQMSKIAELERSLREYESRTAPSPGTAPGSQPPQQE